MKKILMTITIALCALSAQAGEYGYLLFTNTGGTITAFGVSNLTLTVSGSNLQVKNDEGTVNLVLTELALMQFSTSSDSVTALENVLNGDEPVRVFSLSGASLGSFGSLREAASSLSPGSYVISNGTNSQTIILQ